MISQAQFFSSDSAKGTVLVEKTKKLAELHTLNIDFKRDVKRALYGPGHDLDCFYQTMTCTDEKSQKTVICRTYQANPSHRDRLLYKKGPCPRDHLYKKDIEIEQQLGHHPNLLRCIGVAEDKQFNGNVLIYENGGTAGNLDEMLSKATSDSESQHLFSSRVRWTEEAISAIGHIHQLGLVHGDLTPTNIIFDKAADSHVHLKIANMTSARFDADYLSELVASTSDGSKRPDPDRVRWLSPEECLGGETSGEFYKQRKDIWQLGILLAELILLKLPYAAYKSQRDLAQVLGKQSPYAQEELQAVGPTFANFISQCCEMDPEKRPTMKQIVDELWPVVMRELKEKIKLCETPAHHVGESATKAPIARLGRGSSD